MAKINTVTVKRKTENFGLNFRDARKETNPPKELRGLFDELSFMDFFGANKRSFIGLLKEYAPILTYYCAPTDNGSCRSVYSVPYLFTFVFFLLSLSA